MGKNLKSRDHPQKNPAPKSDTSSADNAFFSPALSLRSCGKLRLLWLSLLSASLTSRMRSLPSLQRQRLRGRLRQSSQRRLQWPESSRQRGSLPVSRTPRAFRKPCRSIAMTSSTRRLCVSYNASLNLILNQIPPHTTLSLFPLSPHTCRRPDFLVGHKPRGRYELPVQRLPARRSRVLLHCDHIQR